MKNNTFKEATAGQAVTLALRKAVLRLDTLGDTQRIEREAVLREEHEAVKRLIDFFGFVSLASKVNRRLRKKITWKLSTLDIILCPVDGKYGAPMGRVSFGEKGDRRRVFRDAAVPLTDGYDRGGAYWGMPNNLRVKYTDDLTYVNFYRQEPKTQKA